MTTGYKDGSAEEHLVSGVSHEQRGAEGERHTKDASAAAPTTVAMERDPGLGRLLESAGTDPRAVANVIRDAGVDVNTAVAQLHETKGNAFVGAVMREYERPGGVEGLEGIGAGVVDRKKQAKKAAPEAAGQVPSYSPAAGIAIYVYKAGRKVPVDSWSGPASGGTAGDKFSAKRQDGRWVWSDARLKTLKANANQDGSGGELVTAWASRYEDASYIEVVLFKWGEDAPAPRIPPKEVLESEPDEGKETAKRSKKPKKLDLKDLDVETDDALGDLRDKDDSELAADASKLLKKTSPKKPMNPVPTEGPTSPDGTSTDADGVSGTADVDAEGRAVGPEGGEADGVRKDGELAGDKTGKVDGGPDGTPGVVGPKPKPRAKKSSKKQLAKVPVREGVAGRAI